MLDGDIQKCFDQICKNYSIRAGLNITKPVVSRENYSEQFVFIDMMVGSYFSAADLEILRNIAQQGVKSKKDYRKLRALVRLRLLNALRKIQELAEDGIRNLGAKV